MDSLGTSIRLYLPRAQWNYLRWLIAQGFDLDGFTKACDHRRREMVEPGEMVEPDVHFADFVSVATYRLQRLHYQRYPDGTHLVQPVFPHQMQDAIDKAAAFFQASGPDPMRTNHMRS